MGDAMYSFSALARRVRIGSSSFSRALRFASRMTCCRRGRGISVVERCYYDANSLRATAPLRCGCSMVANTTRDPCGRRNLL